MSAREWKPGDVALVEAGCWANAKVAFRLDEGWAHVNGVNVDGDGIVSPVRRLVVIDPEDVTEGGDVDRLTKMIVEACYRDGNTIVANHGIHPHTTRDALREFASPTPPIEEPQGFGAVVRDDRGKRWTRVKDGFNWRWRDDHFGEQTAWEHLVKRGVRVLFEGVAEGGA